MNEVGGTESGTGLRATKNSRTSDANFEYDDSEWDVGIGNLIIDLDADIEKNNEANKNNNNSTGGSSTTSSTGGSTSSNNNLQQMHIPLTSSSGSNSNTKSGKSGGSGNGGGSQAKGSNTGTTSTTSTTSSSSSSDINTVMEHSSIVDKGLKMKIKRTKTGTKSGADAKHEIVKNDVVVGSSNGTTGGTSSTNSNYSSNKSISDSISSSKNSHSSHKDKDKLLMKDGLLHDNSHDNSSSGGGGGSINNATSGKDGEHGGGGGGKVKTPRKGSTKEKKTKNSGNVGNSGNNKKDESNTKALSNSGSGGSSAGNSNSSSSGTHAKDNKEFFSTTVNLNVPNVIPNSSSSAFVKTTATIKVPTAPSSNSSVLSSSNNSALHNVHSSGGDSSSSSSRSQGLTTGNNSSASSNSSTPWGTVSPSKGVDKGRLSPSVTNLSNASEKSSGNSYNKKGRAFATSADKSGSTQDENSAGSHGGPSSNSSYRNQGALVNSSATDLSSGSSNFVQGVPGTQSGNGGSFGSPKEGGSVRNATPSTQDVCIGTSVGTVTEPDCLGPCEPGTSVTLEGIVWHETESGVLVVNVTWRGKTYVGTLIDCTKNDWAPPRFCDSPASDLEMRTPKNRGKRGRAQTATPVNEPVVADTRSANAKLRNGAKGRRGSNTATAFVAPASPVKPDPWPKRKTRGSENESQEEVIPKNAKRLKVSKDSERKERRSNSPAADNEKSGPSSPQLIECPEPNCSKKYTHMNGLRYHLTHAHSNNFVAQEDSDSNMSTASTTNTSTQQESAANSNNDAVEPMMVDGSDISENSNSSKTATSNLIPDTEPISAPSTPGKKSSNATTPTTPASKVDDKIYDLSLDADLNPGKDLSQDVPEPYGKSPKVTSANKPQGKEATSSIDSDSKLVPENLSKDSSSSTSSSSSSSASTTPTMSTPTLTPRTPILTVPVVPSYMSLQNRNLVHGHVVNVPRVEPRDTSENSCSPMKNSGGQGSSSKNNAPWQPHAQGGMSQHVMNTSPPSQSINVPLNIPMNISEKLGGGASAKDKDKNGSSPDQTSSKKNKHKKKSKDRDRERDGKSKENKEKQDMASKGLNIPMSGGPSDYSRSSGMFHSSSLGADRSKDLNSGDDNDSSRKNSLENRDDPQSPAYSDISDANDSGPDVELNVGGSLKDTSVKGLVIPGELKKDPVVPGVPGAPPYQFFNHNLHSPYLDSLSYAASRQQNKDNVPAPVPGNVPEDSEKNRPGGPIKHPNLPLNSQAPSTSTVVGGGGSGPGPVDDPRRSPKMDFSKYPYPNYFSYPYSGYHPYENNPFANSLPPSENSFNTSAQGRMFPGMEDREKEGGPGNASGKGDKPGDKDLDVPPAVQIKQEPIERDERIRKDSRTQSHSMTISDEKNHEVKREFGSDHGEPKLVPPYMTNSSSNKHKEHSKRDREDRHDSRRHDSKDLDSKAEKSSRSSSSNMDKNKNSEDSEPKERKDEGAKPTMETTGPPPPPTASAYYLAQSFLPSNPFGIPFDPSHPLYRNMLVPGPYPGSPYGLHPGSMPRFSSPGGPTPLPEDLSRPNPGGPPGNPKALDLLQHHAAAAQYYSSHKIHELQERALKSPSPQVAAAQRAERDGPPSGPGGPPTASSPGGHPLGGPGGVPHSVGGGRSNVGGASVSGPMPKPADLSKDTKPTIGPGGTLLSGGPNSDNVRTPPPTQHHVHSHTHHHTHVGIGYPIIPTVPPQYSPHYGVLATPPAAPSVIPPFPAQKPN